MDEETVDNANGIEDAGKGAPDTAAAAVVAAVVAAVAGGVEVVGIDAFEKYIDDIVGQAEDYVGAALEKRL